jgi:excisionase family DNA binding protein
MQNAIDAQFLATVIQAATDPVRRAAILSAATTTKGGPRMGSIREAAAILGTCERTVWRYAHNGTLPCVHLSPRKIRFDLAAVERFATTGTAASRHPQQ